MRLPKLASVVGMASIVATIADEVAWNATLKYPNNRLVCLADHSACPDDLGPISILDRDGNIYMGARHQDGIDIHGRACATYELEDENSRCAFKWQFAFEPSTRQLKGVLFTSKLFPQFSWVGSRSQLINVIREPELEGSYVSGFQSCDTELTYFAGIEEDGRTVCHNYAKFKNLCPDGGIVTGFETSGKVLCRSRQ